MIEYICGIHLLFYLLFRYLDITEYSSSVYSFTFVHFISEWNFFLLNKVLYEVFSFKILKILFDSCTVITSRKKCM